MNTNERIAKEIMGWDAGKLDQGMYEGCLDACFDSSLEACFQMEEKIKELPVSEKAQFGWVWEYIQKLKHVIEAKDSWNMNTNRSFMGPEGWFKFAHATAAQRAEAAIRMLDELKRMG